MNGHIDIARYANIRATSADGFVQMSWLLSGSHSDYACYLRNKIETLLTVTKSETQRWNLKHYPTFPKHHVTQNVAIGVFHSLP